MKSLNVSNVSKSAQFGLSRVRSLGLVPRFAVFVILVGLAVGLIASSFYIGSSASSAKGTLMNDSTKVPEVHSLFSLPRSSQTSDNYSVRSFLRVPQPATETINTFAADCTTPRNAFVLGETVCAKTDNVTETDRFVNWCVACPTIAYGGQGVTDIIPANQPQNFLYTPTVAGTWKATIADPSDSSIIPTVFTVTAQTAPLATYAADCATPKTTFTLGDTVCARASGITPGFSRRFAWTDPAGFIRQLTPLATDPQTDSFPLPGTNTSIVGLTTVDNRGGWKVSIISSRGSTIVASPFEVKGATASVDLSIGKGLASSSVDSGQDFSFIVAVTNSGPDDAANVSITDVTPLNATFKSATQTSGSPAFSCNGTSTVTCNGATLAAGARVIFEFVYTAGAAGSTVTNTATVSSDTAEINSDDNSSTAEFRIGNGGTANSCVIECPNNMIISANTSQNNQPGAYVTYSPEPFGSCGAITNNPASGSFFPVGTTQVSSTSATGGGACSFTITVIESAPPTISCPSNISVVANSGQNTAYVPDPNGSSSDPGTPTTTGSGVTYVGQRSDQEPLGNAYPVGVTLITWTATDNGGRTASCTQRITVTSPDAPTIACPSDKTFTAPSGSCTYTATAGEIGTPTTGGASVTVTSNRSDSQALTDPYPAGQTLITWTATNSFGSASCTQKITVLATDTTPPTLQVPADVNATTSTCSATLDDELGVATATDNCTSSVNIVRTGVPRQPCPTPSDPNRTCESFVFPTGTTIVTYTATDAAGNATVGTQRVTVLENPAIPPTIAAPGDVTVSTGPGATFCGTFVGDATLGTASASDNCPGVTVSRSGVPAGNNFPVGNTTITYTATDRSGNTATATQKVTVVDDTVPVVTAPGPVTLNTGANATSCSVTVSNLNATFGTGSATDNCPGVGAVTRSGVPSGNVFPVGNTTLTYSATDAHGNTGSATQVVTVVDNTPPTISCPANIVLEPTCPSGAIATYAAPVVGDNCGVQGTTSTTSPTLNLVSGSVFPIGTTTVTDTVTDIHGNSRSCSFTVTVKTVAQTIADLRASVNSSSLSGTQKQGLVAKLDAATDALAIGHTMTACSKLADFINSTQNYIDHGNVSAAVGNAWISTAAHVRNTIGCTNNPCS